MTLLRELPLIIGVLSFAIAAGATPVNVGVKPGSSSIGATKSPSGFSRQEVSKIEIRENCTNVPNDLINVELLLVRKLTNESFVNKCGNPFPKF